MSDMVVLEICFACKLGALPFSPLSPFAAYTSWEFLGVGTVPHTAEMVSV